MDDISNPLGTQAITRDPEAIPLGGPGSGHYGHAGRPGKRGGSLPSDVAVSIAKGRTAAERQRQASARGAAKRAGGAMGNKTQAFGNDPNTKYDLTYRVVPMKSLIASNLPGGAVNPAYDPDLQPRDRSRAASQAQIDSMASNLSPEAVLWEFHQLDKGTPIVGPDLMVESGNGRTLALQMALDNYPDEYGEYQDALAGILSEYGIDPEDIKGIKNPVLVRVRDTIVDRKKFVSETNAPAVLQMSPLERAAIDAGKIKETWLNLMRVQEGQSIDQALRTAANQQFVKNVMGQFDANERATLMRSDGTLNRMGLWRIKAAIFSKVFPGKAGQRLAETFLESLDVNIKNFENAMGDVLPRLAQAESLMASGQRAAGLSLSRDISKAIDMLARLKESGQSVSQYINQGSLWQRETSARQDVIMGAFDTMSRSRKDIREALGRYADAVIASPNPSQGTMMGFTGTTVEQLLKHMLEGTR